jgi:hypothetical protein
MTKKKCKADQFVINYQQNSELIARTIFLIKSTRSMKFPNFITIMKITSQAQTAELPPIVIF